MVPAGRTRARFAASPPPVTWDSAWIGEGRGTTLLIALCGAGAIALIPISMSRGLREIRPAREADDAEEPALQPATAH